MTLDLLSTSSAFAGLAISFYVPRRASPRVPTPNAFLRIAPDDSITVLLAHAELCRGTWTGLAMLIAEELDCDWAHVRSEHVPAAPIYAHTIFGVQIAGGSTATYAELDRYRSIGAAARDMLVRAAARRLGVEAWRLRVSKGVIAHGDASVTFGQVADAAMQLPPPARVKLKEPSEWRLIGTRVRRLAAPTQPTQASVGVDLPFAELRTAVVARPPSFGTRAASYDASRALRVPGVEAVVPTETGVAVVAKQFWSAKLGRDALAITWTAPESDDSANVLAELRALVRRPGTIVEEVGRVDARLALATTRVIGEYAVPCVAHAPMEPLDCAVRITGDRCELWTGTELQANDLAVAAAVLGTTPDKVTVHPTVFGQRASPTPDFVREAVTVAKAAGVPVKTVWTREDDVYYRPAFVHRMDVGLDANGIPIAWSSVSAGQATLASTPMQGATSLEGLLGSPYLEASSARRLSLHSPRPAVPVLWWRSAGHLHTAFAIESMVDELAHAVGREPLEYRLALLRDAPRFAATLRLAASTLRWGSRVPEGRARGLAVHASFGSIVAQAVEVSADGGTLRVHDIACAIDCGTAVNPLGIEAQVQSAISVGLTATLPVEEMPRIRVRIINSKAKMGGISEAAVAPLAPAIANAVFALAGQRVRTLPLRLP